MIENDEFDVFAVLERAVHACDGEGLSIGDGFRALEEVGRLRAELTQARNELLTLHARMGEIVDTATMPMPEYWRKE